MKLKSILMVIPIVLLVIPSYAGASIVFETTGWIIDTEADNFSFMADVSPFTYIVTLADLSPPGILFGFDSLFLSITTSTDNVDDIIGPGSFTFSATPGETYFANIFGTGGGDENAGLYGLEIKAVPIPTTLMLLGSGLIGLAGIRWRFRKN